MKYEVITDREGYCVIVRHTGTKRDYVELDLENYDLTNGRINAYKLGKNELIFDNSKWDSINNVNLIENYKKEIAILKQRLTDTDYIAARWFEEILSLNNALTWVADVIRINIRYSNEYKDILRKRIAWRQRIQELEEIVNGR